MKKLFLNTIFWICFALLLTSASLIYSIYSKDWSWFARSGSILTLVGVTLSGRAILREGQESFLKLPFRKVGNQYFFTGNMNIGAPPEVIPQLENLISNEMNDAQAAYIGFIIAIIGTIIWGYGDLLPKLIFLKNIGHVVRIFICK